MNIGIIGIRQRRASYMNKKRKKGIMDYIFQFAGEYKSTYIKSIIFAVIGVFFSLTPYILMGDMVKKLFLGERDFYAYLMEGLAMAALWIFRVVFHTLSTNISHRTTFKLISNVRILLIDKLSRLPLGAVQRMPSGELKNIICERTDSMEPILAHVVPEFTANILAPIVLFLYILTIDWRMALLSLATLPVAGIAMIWMFKDMNVRFQKTQTTTKELNDTAVEYIGGIEVIKAFGKAESSYRRFADAAKENANSFIEWMKSCIIPFSLGMVIAPATLLSVLPIGAIFTMNGSLSLTDYIMIVILSCGLISPLITVMSYNDDITKATSIFKEIVVLEKSSSISTSLRSSFCQSYPLSAIYSPIANSLMTSKPSIILSFKELSYCLGKFITTIPSFPALFLTENSPVFGLPKAP